MSLRPSSTSFAQTGRSNRTDNENVRIMYALVALTVSSDIFGDSSNVLNIYALKFGYTQIKKK